MNSDGMIGIMAFTADYVSKRAAEEMLPLNEDGPAYANGHVILKRVNNNGTAGGHFAGEKAVIAMNGLAAAMAALDYHMLKKNKASAFSRAGASLMLAGGLGNLNDRVMRGEVTDFIRFKTGKKHLDKLVFNLADGAVFAGVALSMIGVLADHNRK